MQNIVISKEQARQFAYDWYDVIVQDIRATREQEETINTNSGLNEQSREERKIA